MINMPPIEALFNGFLVGASGYALYSISPTEHPYAFTACAISMWHGVFGLVTCMKEEPSEDCKKGYEVCTSVMEIVPLPLVNIELYLMSEQSSSLALGHGLFIIPLTFDLISKLFCEEGEESNTETLKDLTILGNVISLLFLAVNEGNFLYGSMALTAFLTKYGAMLLESLAEGTGANTTVFGHSVFNILTAVAVGGATATAGETPE